MNPLKSDEYPAFYSPYIDTVVGDPLDALIAQKRDFAHFIEQLPADKGAYAYAEGKWTVKEVLGHVIDTERVMAYRALRFARNDTKALAGFEQDEYVQQARFQERSFADLAEEFQAVREATIQLFRHFYENEWQRKGMASDRLISVRALLYIILGHLNHHRSILRDRYGV